MGYLPPGGFMYLATSKGYVISALKHVISDFCKTCGDIEPFYDDNAFEACALAWQEELHSWSETYRREFAEANGSTTSDETISHIKYAGALLHAFTQSDSHPVQATLVNGVLPPRLRDLVAAHPNEFLMFHAVYWLFTEQQYQRDIPLLYDPERPPMNPRYARAMVHYLRTGPNGQGSSSRTAADFYMIFKTMDLYGVKADYAT